MFNWVGCIALSFYNIIICILYLYFFGEKGEYCLFKVIKDDCEIQLFKYIRENLLKEFLYLFVNLKAVSFDQSLSVLDSLL